MPPSPSQISGVGSFGISLNNFILLIFTPANCNNMVSEVTSHPEGNSGFCFTSGASMRTGTSATERGAGFGETVVCGFVTDFTPFRSADAAVSGFIDHSLYCPYKRSSIHPLVET